MLTIGQVASRMGLRASAIRYYEAQGLLPRPSRMFGKRIYDTAILERLTVIELAKSAGFALKEIRVLVSNVNTDEPVATWRKLVPAKEVEIDAQIKRLAQMKDILAKLNACSCATLQDCGQAFIAAQSKRKVTLPKRKVRKLSAGEL